MTGESPVDGTPLVARVRLAHGVVQVIADSVGADLLHLKGPAFEPRFRSGSVSVDADVLVRPSHLERLVAAMRDHSCEQLTTFETGSAFEHAENWHHPGVGSIDLHRKWPGATVDPELAFDILWEHRRATWLAHRRCASLDESGQLAVVVLHAARSNVGGRGIGLPPWEGADEELRCRTRALVARLGAQLAFSVGIGELDAVRDDPGFELWASFYDENQWDKLSEWHGRLRSASGARAKARVTAKLVTVNRLHLRMSLGREPTARDIASAWLRRWVTVADALRDRLRARW